MWHLQTVNEVGLDSCDGLRDWCRFDVLEDQRCVSVPKKMTVAEVPLRCISGTLPHGKQLLAPIDLCGHQSVVVRPICKPA